MTLGWRLFMLAVLLPVLPILYVMLRDECEPKKNIIVGVTLPYAAQSDSVVRGLLEQYKREMRLACWAMLAAAIPNLLFSGFGSFLTYWLVWVVALCVVPFIPYIRCNKALRQLKEARGWKRAPDAPQAVADLQAAAQEMRWLSPWWFLPPLAASLAPLAFDWTMWPLWLADALIVPVCWLCYRCLYRNRTEVVDGDSHRTMALTRVRRYNWGKFWLTMAWATGFFNIGMWLTIGHVWLCMGVILLYGVVICTEAVGIELRVRRLQEKLTADCGAEYVDEDDRWIWGMFYYNPNDSRMMVNARVGINATFNLAKRPAQIIALFLVALLLACPLFGVWMMGMERAPVELAVTETEVTGTHYTDQWSIAREDIVAIEVITDLPRLRRVAGTGMDSALTGQFNGDGWGRLTLCIDPRQGPWLLIEKTDGTLFLFGGSQEGAAAAAAERLR